MVKKSLYNADSPLILVAFFIPFLNKLQLVATRPKLMQSSAGLQQVCQLSSKGTVVHICGSQSVLFVPLESCPPWS